MPDLYNPDYLKHLCQKYGLSPSKQYGQNYLLDAAVIEEMLVAAELATDDAVVEVGPGFGILTLALAPKVKKVMAFEIEKKLEPYWEGLAKQYKNLEIIWGNILKKFPISNISEIPLATGQYPNGYKVVANLPYQITSPVIRLFLENEFPPTLMVTMVQKEVGERMCAKPGQMSVLAVATQYFAVPEIVRVVPRALFWPEPKVDSVVIKLRIKSQELRSKEFEKKFFDIVRAGFANRRKLLIKNLTPIVGKKNRPELEKIFTNLGLTGNSRAQELSMEQWKELVHKIQIDIRY
ncbi:MAG: ribosomal RNA small subunit methyltransferase A [Candidatus Magasanikbacteria bacterium RIFCSPHIGHO2_01_FULL_47_8]|uniref:Ribosomal RNA small subunit methyltransferase A n=1 Tax=Candidatus Magasanikbacteria bacterium RIFCSPHIGHO2_01_FULL_47_8 TaxID=1798673 RepID=A0A1F6MBW9_9BACT|nr:MAG: ribosomal RNA small subunit methyltransferase A [Candidatus Magasanikbacteria bacterium RIFCSPHIGHO2_01_FULL_47_8]